mgnify:CR=1 FL=1
MSKPSKLKQILSGRKPKLPNVSSITPAITSFASKSINTISPKFFTDILFKKNKRIQLFLALEPRNRLTLFRTLTPSVRKDILNHLPDDELVSMLHLVDPDEATDMLQLLPIKRREKLLQQVGEELRNSLSTLLEFDAKSAAGLMTLDYVLVDLNTTIASVADKFKNHERATGRPPVIIALKEDGSLAGFVPGYILGVSRSSDKIEKFVKKLPSVSSVASHEEVAKLFHTHPHAKIAVKNNSGNVIGIIYSNDILQLMQDHESSSLYDLAGIVQEESVSDSVRRKVNNRYQWLIINAFTAFLAAYTVSRFQGIISEFVLLAAYMPIVAGMGGNASMQTFAVLVRGITLGQISLRTAWRALGKELGAGLINGIIIAIFVSVIVYLLNGDTKISLVLALAMVINLINAAFFGTLVPLVMHRLGKDPATSASIFITTATDVIGFMAFLGLATIILK